MIHTPESELELIRLSREQHDFLRQNMLTHVYYTNEGITFDGKYYPPRHLYPKHLEFFKSGLTHLERAVVSGNQVGKTTGLGGFEVASHLLQDYPDWWEGLRFYKPVTWVVAGKTSATTRDICQTTLFGDANPKGKSVERLGLVPGFIPPEKIVDTTPQPGNCPRAFMDCWVEGKYGVSRVIFKAYGQGRDAMEGLRYIQGVWVDEEPPSDFYNEAKMRLITQNPSTLICTFTPVDGYTEVVAEFIRANPDIIKIGR